MDIPPNGPSVFVPEPDSVAVPPCGPDVAEIALISFGVKEVTGVTGGSIFELNVAAPFDKGVDDGLRVLTVSVVRFFSCRTVISCISFSFYTYYGHTKWAHSDIQSVEKQVPKNVHKKTTNKI